MTTKPKTKINQTKSGLQKLIARGKEQGYLTYAEVNDHLPNDIVDPEQIEDIVNMINDMGITVYEKAPDTEELILSDNAVSNDDDAADEAAAALASVDSEFGRTTDPVRMYMREMGIVELLTREGEIRIAKRIEKGLNQVRGALVMFPPTMDMLLDLYEPVAAGDSRLVDVIAGFIDPNQTDEVQKPKTKNGTSDDDTARFAAWRISTRGTNWDSELCSDFAILAIFFASSPIRSRSVMVLITVMIMRRSTAAGWRLAMIWPQVSSSSTSTC